MKNLFASRLEALLKEHNLSKRALAAKIGVSATSISDWTNGKILPTAESIYAVSMYFILRAYFLLVLVD